MLRVKSPQDLGAGLVFLFIGCVGLYFGKDLTYGSARAMGPGFFPIWLSWIINFMGAVCLIRSVTLDGDPILKIQIRPILWVSVGVLLFGYLIEHVKLELALLTLTVVATQARRQTDLTQKIVGAFAILFGIAIIATRLQTFGFLKPFGEAVFNLAPWICLALFLIYALMTWAERDARQTVILAVCMSIAAVTVFVVILGQAMPTYTADYISPIFSKIGSIFSGIRGR
jgi:hypothetical protein